MKTKEHKDFHQSKAYDWTVLKDLIGAQRMGKYGRNYGVKYLLNYLLVYNRM